MFFGPAVDDDTQAWVIDSVDWAIANRILHGGTRLIVPDRQTFPAAKGDHRAVAKSLVGSIQALLGIPDARIDVMPIDAIPAEYRIDYNALSAVGGSWQQADGTALITYDPANAGRPLAFLSTLVHEVMHQRLHQTALDMPGGPEAEELSTDLHCITAGFGAIQMAGAEEAGWQGYLRQETRAFALAVFNAVTATPEAEATSLLPPRSARMLRKSERLLRGWEDDIADLAAALARSAR